jgi:hypothetical protein
MNTYLLSVIMPKQFVLWLQILWNLLQSYNILIYTKAGYDKKFKLEL